MIYIYLAFSLVIIVLVARNYSSNLLIKNWKKLFELQSTKLVKLTEENYLLNKKCDFFEKQLYPNKKQKKQYDLEDILDDINKFGIDKLSKDKLHFLKFGDHNKNV